MVSRKYKVHHYIDDGIVYTNQVFDEHGDSIRASRVWELWQHVRPNAAPPMKKIMSYDNGLVTGNITDMQICGNKTMMLLSTVQGRKVYVALGSSLLTTRGYLSVKDMGIGTKLVTTDCYKYYYGDQVPLRTDGNSRIRAFLRNHQVPFVIDGYNGTITDNWTLYCHDFDTDGPVVEGHRITYGLNNYREGLKKLTGLPDTSTDEVATIKVGSKTRYVLAFYVDNPQNIVLENGLIVQSTQTAVRDV